MKSLAWLGAIGWLVMFAVLFLLDQAKPQVENFFDRMFGVKRRATWDLELARYIFYLMILGLALSGLGLGINAKRHRRKKDKYRISLILLGLFSILGIILYLF